MPNIGLKIKEKLQIKARDYRSHALRGNAVLGAPASTSS